MRRRLYFTSFLATFCLAMGLVTGAGPAQATYPGTNGRLAFGLDTGDGNVDVYSVKPNGNALRRLTQAPSFDGCPAYSADGTSIAFCSTRSGTLEVWTMNANGTQQHQLTHTGQMAGFPDYSPDGARIAFFGRLPGDTNDDVFVVNTDGTGLVRLTSDAGNDQFPAWSPDGAKLAFLSDRTGVAQVWVMDADGASPQQLTTDPAAKDQVPDWSPDGTRIAYASFATGGDIYVMGADGSHQTRLTSNPARDLGPAWSPDGTKIAFLSTRDLPVARNVYLMNADGSNQHPVHPGGIQFVPAWQPLPPEESG